ncbi:type 2 isopentenyl-diphosphate Delta-isomerase [Companilactobacillus sp. RD055328]|uniref:type 2 isopentenyl-diphosphate Delta-isomerase n=1 Tax=Companilactobacillus sp. RD055328 TaxID=2916634 RepID=UPI001FC87E8C|nr:type 2 isopentenyl-diphosphate Delta-isomerase [Companilactobacillus sp. RD055328]GKQ42675.1 type 2 isopentenyl-diphosphate Delta-isomerase [Companilactobacillus sp. RD055328]
MPKQPQQQQRKNEHLFLAEKFYEETNNKNFSKVRFIHDSVPEISVSEINLTSSMFDHTIKMPIYINAMTGGSLQSEKINDTLSKIANRLNLPMAVGSMSAAINYPEVADSFKIVRKNNPDGVIIANISANHSAKDAQQVIDLIEANALQIHVNTLQELSMPEGDRNFYWLDNIKDIINSVSVPVIVKEVGFGMSKEAIAKLKSIGVTNIDLSGAGGTDFIQIENERNHEFDMSFLEELKITTVESLLDTQVETDGITIFASGGIRTPLDVLKCLRLGADYVGISGLILHQVQKKSYEEVLEFMTNWLDMVKIGATAIGARNITELRNKPIILDQDLYNYFEQRKS